jgi:hypothetical protein
MDVGADNFRFTLDDPEKKARTSRQPMCAELHINSLDRYTSQPGIPQPLVQLAHDITEPSGSYNYSSTDCVIQPPGRAMLYGYFDRIALTEMQLFVRIPTVVTGVNDTFYLKINPGGVGTPVTYLFTMPGGYYTPVLLASAMQTIIRNATTNLTTAGSFTVTAPSNPATLPASGLVQTGFILSTGTTDTIVFDVPPAGTSLASQYATWKFYRLIGTNQLAFTGFPSNIPTANLYTFSPNFLPTDYIDVVSKALTNYKDVKDSNSNQQSVQGVIARVYLTDSVTSGSTNVSMTDPNPLGSAPFSFTKRWIVPNYTQWSPNQAINQVDIKLLDMWGDPIFWTNTKACANTEWQMTLLASG